ncbi:hypothetical protein ACFP81_06670 [Deinococcus lacus]|uniref:Uncharacterized protein n=1 Tax=Deinococcus lacus TaxID=392561 RepID=A0ABW1YCF7_9DEIO
MLVKTPKSPPRPTLRRMVLAAAALGALGGSLLWAAQPAAPECWAGFEAPDRAALAREHAGAQARWQDAGLRDYRYDLIRSSAPDVPPQPETVTVRGGEGGVSALLAELGATITALGPCQTLTVRYDPQLSYPLEASFADQSKHVADHSWSYRVSSLRAVP